MRVILFGTGQQGMDCLHVFGKLNLEIVAFCDNNPEKVGKFFHGYQTIHPNELVKYSDCKIVVCVIQAQKIYDQLDQLGIQEYYHPIEFLQWYNRIWEKQYKDLPCKISVVVYGRDKEQDKRGIEKTILDSDKNCGEVLFVEDDNIIPRNDYVVMLNANTKLGFNFLYYLYQAFIGSCSNSIVGSKEITSNYKIVQAGYTRNNQGFFIRNGATKECFDMAYDYVKSVDSLSLNGLFLKKEDFYELLKIYDSVKDISEAYNLFLQSKVHYKIVIQPYSMLMVNNTEDDSIFWEKLDGIDKDNRIALFMDNAIAAFDQNAGARSSNMYINVLSEKYTNILYSVEFLSVTDYKYVEYFQQLGLYVFFRDSKRIISEYGKEISYIFINRPDVANKYIDILRKECTAPIIHYGHDVHHIRLSRQYELTHDETLLPQIEKYKKLEIDLLRKVDLTGYPSIHEVEYFKQLTRIDSIRYFPLIYCDTFEQADFLKERKGIMFVGGFRHQPNVDGALWFINKIIPLVRKNNIRDKIYIIGSFPTDEMKALETDDIIITGYISDEELEAYYKKCRVAVVPLRYGAGMKGKVLEAMGYGIPLVTTSVGAEGLFDVSEIIDVVDDEQSIALKIKEIYELDQAKLVQKSMSEQDYLKRYFGKDKMIEAITL